MPKMNPSDNESKSIHDINSSLNALLSSLEVIKDEWKNNPELINQLMPLVLDKTIQLKTELDQFYQIQK
jgi:hypothetical protein